MRTLSTPGVYSDEVSAFPNSVIPIATAVPAFVGYTPKAEFEGKSYYNQPVYIDSFAEYLAIFALPTSSQQYSPQYYLIAQTSESGGGPNITINGSSYTILPDQNTIYYMYNSIRLFFLNGGGRACIVSVGPYGGPSGVPLTSPGIQCINPNVTLADLQAGLALLKNETVPSLYLCPEATLLSPADNTTLVQSMLLQAQKLQTAVCLFDVINGNQPTQETFSDDIQAF
ncbi:hypothetical protein, partial [Elstera litoralis]|uniref:hypothetical protein n=1 Tax=Elstera litoralis TaxID=552518 RepID=UPI000B1166C9